MKNFIPIFILIIGIFYIFISNSNKHKQNYKVNSDTNVSQVKGLSEYITQEEIDDFAMRYSDIAKDKEKNATLIPLREALESGDTQRVLHFLKENNLSADVRMWDKRTPLMYSSFYDDVNTAKELLKLKADVNSSDRYRLSPLAYAIENNSTKTVKLLIANGARFEDVKLVKARIDGKFYSCIDSIEIYDDNTTKINYCKTDPNKRYVSRGGVSVFDYAVGRNLIEILEMILKSGYKPKILKGIGSLPGLYNDAPKNTPYASTIIRIPNYKQVLKLCLKYVGKPSKEHLKKAYGYCYKFYKKYKIFSEDKTFYYDSLNKDILNNYTKYCSKKDGTFTPETYFAWANEWEKLTSIRSFKKQHKDKVFYIKSVQTPQTTERIENGGIN